MSLSQVNLTYVSWLMVAEQFHGTHIGGYRRFRALAQEQGSVFCHAHRSANATLPVSVINFSLEFQVLQQLFMWLAQHFHGG
jgi:hypothetical protein